MITHNFSDARTQSPALLLESAARLIEKAIMQLNTTSVACHCCHRTLYEDREQAKVYERLTDLPTRLRSCIEILKVPPVPTIGYSESK